MIQGIPFQHQPIVTPAQAGVHALSLRLTQRTSCKPDGQEMDSRLRGNDEACGCEVGAL
jgi:hypothetical protein